MSAKDQEFYIVEYSSGSVFSLCNTWNDVMKYIHEIKTNKMKVYKVAKLQEQVVMVDMKPKDE